MRLRVEGKATMSWLHWVILPAIIVSKDYRSMTFALAFLPWCVGVDISW